MSWRAATLSAPAPPVTSTTSNNLFGNPSQAESQRTTRFRTISTTSASSHLARQKLEMEGGDDTMSLKSYKSGGSTLLGSSNGGKREGRSRGVSNASSMRSGRTERMDTDTSSSTSNSRPPSPSTSQLPIDRPEAVEGTIPPVIKRQKVLQEERRPDGEGQKAIPRSTSWFGGLDWRAGASITEAGKVKEQATRTESLNSTSNVSDQTSSSRDTTPKPPIKRLSNTKPPAFSRSLSSKSTSSVSRPTILPSTASIPFPSFPTSPYVSTSPIIPSPPLIPSDIPPSPPLSSTTPVEPAPRVRTTSTISKKQSWFGPSLYASERNPPPRPRESPTSLPPPLPLPSPITSTAPREPSPVEPTSTSKSAAFLEVPGVEEERTRAIARNKEKALQLQAERKDEKVRQEKEREGSGWLSMLSGSRYIEPIKAVREEEDGNKMDVDETEVIQDEESSQATIKAPILTSNDDSTVTPKTIKRRVIPSANQRLSWWNWSGASESFDASQTSQPTVEEEVAVVLAPSPVVEEVVEPLVAEEEVMTKKRQESDRGKSWLQSVWGESAAEIAEKAKEAEEVVKRLAATSLLEASAKAKAKAAAVEMPPPPIPNANLELNPESLPRSLTQIQALKHKSSWAFFPTRGGASSSSNSTDERTFTRPTTPSTVSDTTNQAQAIPPRSSTPLASSSIDNRGRSSIPKPVSLLSKSPRVGGGSNFIASSSASSRASSRGDPTNNYSAPNSPLLRPVSDQPLKPLTGSIRSNQRTLPQESAPAFDNLVLPTFSDTFSRPPRSYGMKKSGLNKVVSVMSAYWFSQPAILVGEEEDVRGEQMRKNDPAKNLPKSFEKMGEVGGRLERVKRVVTIGVHGWFPNPMLKSVFGEPTGTSIKFSTMMHDAVQSYLESHDKSSFNIQAIALEGEGQVSVRVELLYAQLIGRPEWIEALKKADVIFVSTHSQGTIVSTHLIDRMLNMGLVDGGKIHLLAMCGIAQGPFVYLSQSYALQPYFNYLESAAARELFEFQDPESAVAKRFLDSLSEILSHGVKITAVGSINDQVVPLYSALFAGISHPSILRAVYIDSAAFRASDFLANLVVFAARVKNAGLNDHDLLYHLSEGLAGALTGVGHSKIYEEEEVFNLAVRYQFETTPLAEAPTFLNKNDPVAPISISFHPKERRNPYLLSWGLRGIVEDPLIRELFGKELSALREAYDTWKPQTKVLKDTKLKLEGIRSVSFTQGGKL